MKEITIRENEAGQRFDKFLNKYLPNAPKSFYYKMLRKKNIVLNGKKAIGNEQLKANDKVKFFLSDITLDKFSKQPGHYPYAKLNIVYEDKHIILINKPAGMLSQKAYSNDVSLVEYLIGYLLHSNQLQEEELASFHPSVCNRLDRNTSGLVAGGKTLLGLQSLSAMFEQRSLKKYYLCLVNGKIKQEKYLKGYLHKDEKYNKAEIKEFPFPDSVPIETEYFPISTNGNTTLLKVHLITGRSHQIRSHLASEGHAVIGDMKYGEPSLNRLYKERYHLTHQLLHAYELHMPKLEGELSYLSGKIFEAKLPVGFQTVLSGENLEEINT